MLLCKNGGKEDKKGLAIDNSAVAVFLLVEEALGVIVRSLAMHSSQERAESRREFLRAAARGGLLALLMAAGRLAARSGAAGQRCANRGVCRGCAVFASCGLPQALSAKGARPGG